MQSVGNIPSFLSAFARLNPGCVTIAKRGEDSRFKRAFVIVKIFADAIFARQRVLGIDCSHSKCSLYSGVQIHLVGRDGNMKNTTIAFALVPAEDGDSYACFFKQVATACYDLLGIPMFCDRGTALLFVTDDFGFDLKFCTLHIL